MVIVILQSVFKRCWGHAMDFSKDWGKQHGCGVSFLSALSFEWHLSSFLIVDLSLIAEFNCLFKNVKYGARMCGCDLRLSLKQPCDTLCGPWCFHLQRGFVVLHIFSWKMSIFHDQTMLSLENCLYGKCKKLAPLKSKALKKQIGNQSMRHN